MVPRRLDARIARDRPRRGGTRSDHVRQILTAPTTEFKMISLIAVLAALILGLTLWKSSRRALRWFTTIPTAICARLRRELRDRLAAAPIGQSVKEGARFLTVWTTATVWLVMSKNAIG